ncbi:MAG TPA: tetratricopeptide repeat protein, partial [Thermoanaerobaculia bacterium]|nr:tetratricopeptide repeat protein [Thermoanaerobaculia bacterium]
ALSLDADNAVAYAIRGTINRDYHWNFRQAYTDLQRSIELNPAGVVAQRVLGGVYYRDGRFAEALEAEKKALDLHPTSLMDHKFLGDYLIAAGRSDEGIAQLNRVIAMGPSFAPAYWSLWRIHHARGEEAQAFNYFIAGKQLAPGSEDDVASLRAIYDVSGWSGVLRAELEQLRSEDSHGGYSPSRVYAAQLATQLGESDLAFQYLEEALEHRLIGLSYLKVDPLLSPLRKDRRYEDLVRRAGL